MTDDRVKTLPVLTTVLLSLMPHARAQQSALECPVAQAAGALDAIKETPSQISELAQILGSGDLGNRIPVFLHALHDRNPECAVAELVNYLVTAYCPVVSSLTGLSTAEKQARLDAFASQVAQAAY